MWLNSFGADKATFQDKCQATKNLQAAGSRSCRREVASAAVNSIVSRDGGGALHAEIPPSAAPTFFFTVMTVTVTGITLITVDQTRQ